MEQHGIIGRLSSGINVNSFSSYFFNAWLIIFAPKTVRANVTHKRKSSKSFAGQPVLDGQPVFSGYPAIPNGLPLNTGSTVF